LHCAFALPCIAHLPCLVLRIFLALHGASALPRLAHLPCLASRTLSPGQSAAGAWHWPLTPSSAEVNKE
jgi:hypothetical protein